MADNTIASKVKAVNEILLAGEPENVSVDTYSGYVGYKPQYIIDAMNEVFGYGEWGFEELSNEIAEGEKALLLVAKVKVSLKGIDFQPSGWGQARITKGDIGDARKGAQTDAIKKALSYFSIGNKAYKGLLDTKKSSTSQQTNQSKNVVESKALASKQIVHPQPSNVASSSDAATDLQLISIRKLCESLGKPVPGNVTSLNHQAAKQLIEQLTAEYREARKSNKAQEQSVQSQSIDDIPTPSQIRATFDDLKPKDAKGNVMTWEAILATAFKQPIADGKVTLENLVKVGDELPPNYCAHLVRFVETIKTSRAKQQQKAS